MEYKLCLHVSMTELIREKTSIKAEYGVAVHLIFLVGGKVK